MIPRRRSVQETESSSVQLRQNASHVIPKAPGMTASAQLAFAQTQEEENIDAFSYDASGEHRFEESPVEHAAADMFQSVEEPLAPAFAEDSSDSGDSHPPQTAVEEFIAEEEESIEGTEFQVKSAIEDSQYVDQEQSKISESLSLNSDALGIKVNKQYVSDYVVESPGFHNVGTPQQLVDRLAMVGYQCLEFLAYQMSLLLNTPTTKIRALLLEGPSGCGKTYMAKSLAKICGAELMCLSCYEGMLTQNLIEYPSTLAMANAMTGKNETKAEDLLNLGIITRAFQKSRTQPVILLIDEIDKTHRSIDTFFLGPIQDARIWLESRAPIDADPENLLVIFTKNFNRKIDEAFLRRCHPIKMTYLDSNLERKILSPHCHPQLVANLVTVADRMRNSGGSYAFERPPAPEELLTAGQYVTKLLEWGSVDFHFVGKNIWAILAKSEHDRAVLEHMMRFHPDFMDPLIADGRDASLNDVYARLGRIVLFNIVEDPDRERREQAWEEIENF